MTKISTFEKAMVIWLVFYSSITSILYWLSPLKNAVGMPASLCVEAFLLFPLIIFLLLLLQRFLSAPRVIKNTPVSAGLPGLENKGTVILYENQYQHQLETT